MDHEAKKGPDKQRHHHQAVRFGPMRLGHFLGKFFRQGSLLWVIFL
jgi:hypothetical protein